MRGEAGRKKRIVIHDDCISVPSPFNKQVRFVTRENWFITNVIREICQNSYVKRVDDPTSPLLPSKNETLFTVFSCGTISSSEI